MGHSKPTVETVADNTTAPASDPVDAAASIAVPARDTADASARDTTTDTPSSASGAGRSRASRRKRALAEGGDVIPPADASVSPQQNLRPGDQAFGRTQAPTDTRAHRRRGIAGAGQGSGRARVSGAEGREGAIDPRYRCPTSSRSPPAERPAYQARSAHNPVRRRSRRCPPHHLVRGKRRPHHAQRGARGPGGNRRGLEGPPRGTRTS